MNVQPIFVCYFAFIFRVGTIDSSIINSNGIPEDVFNWSFVITALFSLLLMAMLFVYIYLALKDQIIVLRNYNFDRAKTCSYRDCGLFHYDRKNPTYKTCKSPRVSQGRFLKLSMDGSQAGCRYSIQVRENANTPRASAKSYLEDWHREKASFDASHSWWKIIMLLIGVILLILQFLKIIDLRLSIF